jgi:type VI secretion system protein ImpB
VAGSVPPEERVSIGCKPAAGDAQEEAKLPLKLLVVGDFTQARDDRALEDRPAIVVDKDNFDDVLKTQNLQLDLTVPNTLSGKQGGKLAVNLKFQSLKDFEPDRLVQKIEPLKKLMELREALKAVKGPLANTPDFRKKVQALVDDPAARGKILKELGLDGKGE